VTQARRPVFYASWGMPDTREGRFETIVLHLAVALRRLAREGRTGQRLAQALAEAFVADVDDSMREMTVGDIAVPKQVRRALGVLYQRHQAYSVALASPEGDALAGALAAQLADLKGSAGVDFTRLGAYMREADRTLASQLDAALLAGRLEWQQV
jgi:cytochrome b pre-mRNA-processing protein 3